VSSSIRIRVDGELVDVREGMTVAAAVVASGRTGFRRALGGQLRGPLCGMGICFECRVRIDGQDHQRSCMIPCVDGMEVTTDGR
jgi:predicted molibdopterin-dependent oxidoreductase YjgC